MAASSEELSESQNEKLIQFQVSFTFKFLILYPPKVAFG